MNSRPLCTLSADPLSEEALTPAHFLIGRQLVLLPEPDIEHINVNLLKRWQLVQKITNDFWQRWRNEYISNLQTRTKWTQPSDNLKINDLVIVKEDNLPYRPSGP